MMFGMIFENIRVAIIGLRSNKLRSALTTLGITIGVSAVIVLVSLGQAVENFVRGQFLGLGTNLILIFPSENDRGERIPLTLSDVSDLRDVSRVPDALAVMPQLNFSRPVSAGGNEANGRIRGVTQDFPSMRNREILAGRFIEPSDVDGLARVAVIGTTVVERLFPDIYPVGQDIRINNIPFRVIGVMAEVGGTAFGGDENDLIFVPITTMQTRLSGQRDLSGARPLTSILVQARDEDSVDLAAMQIRQTLRESRNISFRDQDTFEIFTQTDLLASLGQITGLLTIFLAIIAGISLLVGGIGIMNIMLITVTERTREIGLRKAVGAQKRDILLQFLTEATTLSLVGGGAGITISALGALAISSALPDLAVTVQFSSVVIATLISLAVGVFFGIYPANRAAALDPIDALRYE
ncbi:MAG: ABC transporter permease [Chloroflexi bacterium OLB15]|nr:MAG: ABC transporter permease [Chloroflexi bacterium OLB15]